MTIVFISVLFFVFLVEIFRKRNVDDGEEETLQGNDKPVGLFPDNQVQQGIDEAEDDSKGEYLQKVSQNLILHNCLSS
jgi:hypothetical protein